MSKKSSLKKSKRIIVRVTEEVYNNTDKHAKAYKKRRSEYIRTLLQLEDISKLGEDDFLWLLKYIKAKGRQDYKQLSNKKDLTVEDIKELIKLKEIYTKIEKLNKFISKNKKGNTASEIK